MPCVLKLEKLGLSRSQKPLFWIQVAVSILKTRRFQKQNGRHVAVSEVKRLLINTNLQHNGYMYYNGHFPADTSARSGVVTVI
jgi:hypothetical protein